MQGLRAVEGLHPGEVETFQDLAVQVRQSGYGVGRAWNNSGRPISINQMATQIKAVIADFSDMMANRDMLFPKR